MVEVYQIGALSLGITIGFLVRIFIIRFENPTPKGFATVISVLVGSGIIKFLSTHTDAIWYYSIGLLVGVIAIYPILAYIEIKYNLNVRLLVKKPDVDTKTLDMILSKGGSLKKASITNEKVDFEFYKDGIPNLPKSNPIRQDFEKGLESYEQEKYRDTIKYLNNALKEDPTEEQKTAIYNLIGLSLTTLGDLDVAENNFKKILDLTEEPRPIGVAYGNLGIVYRIRGDLDKALKYYEKALKIDQELGRKEGLASAYVNIGVVYKIKGDLDKALKYYEKALKIEHELGRKEGLANAYGNIGLIYSVKGDLTKAIDYFEKSLSLAFDGGYYTVIISSVPLVIKIYNIQNKPEKVKELENKFKEKYPQLDIPTISD